MAKTRQQIFDRAARGVIAQGKPSIKDGLCKYRAPGNLRCGIGHCIPNKNYRASLEGNTVTDLRVLKAADIDLADEDFAREVQLVHDNSSYDDDFIGEFKRGMEWVAEHYGLSTEALNAKA